jgi:hypothetical protein
LYVEERDAAGNWSAPASLAIKYDLTKPTVAITAPQASGIFITASDTVTVAGTASGPNGIAKIEYTLDGGTASPVTPGTNGSWSLASLTVPNAKTTTVKVTVTDKLGNTGEAQVQILRDSDAPLAPTALVKPTSPTNVAQSSWSWSAGSDGAAGSGLNGKYRWKLNAGNWTEVNTASATGVLLAEGANTFSVEEQDKAGNWSDALTGTAVLDTKIPDAVTFVGIDGSYTSSATPTWTWSPSATNGGIGQYILKLDAGAEFDGGTATTYTPVTPLSDNATHTLTVKEKDQVPGVVGTAKSFSYKVKVNPPAAPAVKSAVASLANNGLTNNPGFAWTSGGGGNGKFRLRLNSETAYRITGAAQTSWSLAPSDADGAYTVHVSEQDDMGRWGAEGNFTIRLDRTPPSFSDVKLVGETFPLRDGYITNVASVTISYSVVGVSGNASRSLPCTLTDNASTLCKAAATEMDSAGNTATFQTSIWRRSNVIFFSPTGAGKKDGTSWENARGDLGDFVANTSGAPIEGKDLWLASGDYTSNPFNVLYKFFNMYGGFNAAAYPTDVNSRLKNTSLLDSIGFSNADGTFLDGVRVKSLSFFTKAVSFKDCQIAGHISLALNSDATFTNCEMTGVNGGTDPIISVSNSNTVTWTGGKITNNIPLGGIYPIEVEAGGTLILGGTAAVNSNGTGISGYQIHNQGALTIGPNVAIDCSTVRNDGGTGTCKGNPLP